MSGAGLSSALGGGVARCSQRRRVGDEFSGLSQGGGPMLGAFAFSWDAACWARRCEVRPGEVGAGDPDSGAVPDRSDL